MRGRDMRNGREGNMARAHKVDKYGRRTMSCRPHMYIGRKGALHPTMLKERRRVELRRDAKRREDGSRRMEQDARYRK